MHKYVVNFHVIGFSPQILTENFQTEAPITPADLDKFEEVTTQNRCKYLKDLHLRAHVVGFSKVK